MSMPTWPDLAHSLSESVQPHAHFAGPVAAAKFERLYGRVQLIEAIWKSLHPDDAKPGAAHREFVQLPFDTVYTTNFDLLLESAYESAKRPYRSLVGDLQIPFHGGPKMTNIVKMHGDIRHPEHVIVTANDYDEYLDRYPVIATHLSSMLIVRTALFIGYSRTDLDFQQIQEVVRSRLGRFQRMHFVIQFNAGLDDIEQALDAGLHIISVPVATNQSRDDALATFLSGLREEVDLRSGEVLRGAVSAAFEPINRQTFERISNSPDASVLYSSTSRICFVAMPVNASMIPVYETVIAPALRRFGLTPVRADELSAHESAMEGVRAAIQQSRIVVCDLTGNNPNVMFEMATAEAMEKPIILLAKKGTRVFSEFAPHQILFYESNGEYDLGVVRARLEQTLEKTILDQTLSDAERLIRDGHNRAGIALLGNVLELTILGFVQSLVPSEPNGLQVRSVVTGIEQLKQRKLISAADANALREFWKLRNAAVHELVEPTEEEAASALDVVRSFTRYHFQSVSD